MKTLRAIALALLGWAALGGSAAMAGTSGAVESRWTAEKADKVQGASSVAVRNKEKIILWGEGEDAEQAQIVHLLVDAPYPVARKAVESALARAGVFKLTAGERQWVTQSEGWEQALVSRRQDLRDKLAERKLLPQLAEAYKRGALTRAEYRELRQDARRKTDWDFNEIADLAELTQTSFQSFCATQDASRGAGGEYTSHLEICVFDLNAAFGHPATSVRISREDKYPNPGYSVWKSMRDFNVLSPGPAATASQHVVPAAAFNAVHAALRQAAPDGRVQVARSNLAWVERSGSEKPAVPVRFAYPYPGPGAAFSNAEVVSWDEVAGQLKTLLNADNVYPNDMLALPGGDLVVGLGGINKARVWRLSNTKGQWTSELVWEGRQQTHQLELGADGKTVWFSGGMHLKDTRLFAYDVRSHKTTAYQVHFDLNAPKTWCWVLGPNSYPVFYASERAQDWHNPLMAEQLQVFAPRSEPPRDGGQWRFTTVLRSPRNGQPVRWRDPKHLWITDGGLAQLEAQSGMVARAFALPQRSGVPYRNSVREEAPWVPPALGSPEAGWIAVGYLVLLADDGNPRPKFEPATTGNAGRFVGMHVVDSKTGEARFSALLGRSETLEAAARSATGKLLALGSNGVGPRASMVALWDVATARAPLQLIAPADGSLRSLAFANSGAELWGLYDKGLARWRLPIELQDPARRGSLPDQAHN